MLDVRELATTELTQGLESLRNRVATDPFCAPFARASWPGDAGLQCFPNGVEDGGHLALEVDGAN